MYQECPDNGNVAKGDSDDVGEELSILLCL
jgi:hypothetical protein